MDEEGNKRLMAAQISEIGSPRLRTKDICVTYSDRCVLTGVSLEFHPGKVTALVGPSGCGKTSFLHTLNRLTDLLPNCSVDGQVFFDGRDVRDRSFDPRILRRRIGMIFQKPNPFPLSIRRNLELPLRERGIRNASEIDDRIEACLKDVGLWQEVKERLKAPAQEMSGGQQQRLCLARALTMEPEVLLMDEPCSALDPISSGVVEDLITELRGRLTIAIVTHNLFQAKRIADDVAMFWMINGVGSLIETSTCTRFFSKPAHPTSAAYVDGLKG